MHLKVLHISKFYYPNEGGIEYFVKDLVESLQNFNIQIKVLAHQNSLGLFSKKEIIKNIYVLRVPILANISYAPICLNFYYFLKKVIFEFKPDLLHIHMPNLSPLLVPFKYRLPLIIHWHADVVSSNYDKKLKFFYNFYRPLEKRLLKQASKIIVTSNNYLKTSLLLKDFYNKCTIIPLGINPDRLEINFNNIKTQHDELPIVLSVGRLTYYKGYEYLIRAMKYVNDARLIIVGEGKEKNRLKNIVLKEKLEEKVLLTGYLSEKHKVKLLKKCFIFCLPSIERTEAFGLSLLEAMYFAKPLITTNVVGSGMNFVNIHQKTGLIVSAEDEKELGRAINFLLANKKLAQKYGQNSKDRFNKLFHINNISQKIIEIYRQFI